MIQELQNNQPLKLGYINHWLKENSANFNMSIEKTECHKWKKWQRNKSTFVLPCLCPTRNNECVFIDIYRELEKYVQYIKTEAFYKNLLEEYYRIQHNQNAVFEWVQDIKQYGNELLSIHPTIRIKITSRPYYQENIELKENELPYLWEFKEIYQGHYYSDEYENYINY
ncbi:hypothetical protein C8C85_1990 [Flavobacterium sp. 103]|uniref:hypothetical protein n=1 Tax=Flavobacterium sp. 103 TaxID=2135624 RepID=UPI000D5DB8D7|nr:hypothetical protein [Flavobacterium sp. 103]PVX46164.1 hypothetical protein C8C85_1990 [Flavobacterium sp. 103]